MLNLCKKKNKKNCSRNISSPQQSGYYAHTLVSTLDEFMAAEELHPHCHTLPSHCFSPRHNRLQMRVGWLLLEKFVINGCVGRIGGALSWTITLGVDVLLWLTEASMFLALGSPLFIHSSFFKVKKRIWDKGSTESELVKWCDSQYDRS